MNPFTTLTAADMRPAQGSAEHVSERASVSQRYSVSERASDVRERARAEANAATRRSGER